MSELQSLLQKPSATVIETETTNIEGMPEPALKKSQSTNNSNRYAEKDEKIKELSNMVKQLVAEQQDMKEQLMQTASNF